MAVMNFTESLQLMVNRILEQDPEALASVCELSGKVIKLEVAGPEIITLLHFEQTGLRLGTDKSIKPDVTIKARPLAFMQLALQRDDTARGPAPDLEIRGDAGLAQRFQKILHTLEIDWEEHLSQWVGDTAAHKLGRMAKHAREFFMESRHTLGLNFSEYFRYEKNMLPDRDEVDEFIAAVDVLRNDMERFRLRLDRLHGKLNV